MATATNGLKGKVRNMIEALDRERQDKDGGRNISLRQYLREQYNLTPGHLFSELGIDPGRTTVQQLLDGEEDNRYLMSEIIREGIVRGMGISQREQMQEFRRHMTSFAPVLSEGNGGTRWITPEVFFDPIMRGAVQSVFYPDLVVREETVPQPLVTMPHLDLSDAQMADTEEAATIEIGSVTYGSKDVKISATAKGITITYEAIMFNTLSLVSLFFEDMGRILGSNLNGKAVTTIVNGDQDDLSEAAAVVGVEATADGITWFDIVRVGIRLGMLGRVARDVVANETTALNYLNMPEVKNKQFPGNPLLPTLMKSPMTTPENLYVSTKVGADKIAIQDSSASLVQLTAQPLLLETEQIVRKRIKGTFASIITGFAKLQRNASIVIDGSVAFSGAGFPAWMAPYSD